MCAGMDVTTTLAFEEAQRLLQGYPQLTETCVSLAEDVEADAEVPI